MNIIVDLSQLIAKKDKDQKVLLKLQQSQMNVKKVLI